MGELLDGELLDGELLDVVALDAWIGDRLPGAAHRLAAERMGRR